MMKILTVQVLQLRNKSRIFNFSYKNIDSNHSLFFFFILDQLDRAFVAIRNGSQDDKLDLTTRVHLLELIELRAKQWRHTDSMDVYYMQKLSHLDNVCKTAGVSSAFRRFPETLTSDVLFTSRPRRYPTRPRIPCRHRYWQWPRPPRHRSWGPVKWSGIAGSSRSPRAYRGKTIAKTKSLFAIATREKVI